MPRCPRTIRATKHTAHEQHNPAPGVCTGPDGVVRFRPAHSSLSFLRPHQLAEEILLPKSVVSRLFALAVQPTPSTASPLAGQQQISTTDLLDADCRGNPAQVNVGEPCACTLRCDPGKNCRAALHVCRTLPWCECASINAAATFATLKVRGPAVGVEDGTAHVPADQPVLLVLGEQKCGNTLIHITTYIQRGTERGISGRVSQAYGGDATSPSCSCCSATAETPA